MFCPSFRSEIFHPCVVPTDLTRFETFPGAACLRRFPVNARVGAKYRGGVLLRAKAAPLQAWHPSILPPGYKSCVSRRSARAGNAARLKHSPLKKALVGDQTPYVFDGDPGNFAECFVGEKRLMGSHQHIRKGEQPCQLVVV